MPASSLSHLLNTITACQVCSDLPLGPNPVVAASPSARILIIGQAPGIRVHETGIPWNDPSGERLRRWMGVDPTLFYDADRIAILPMGFCYPGKGRSGDLPPRRECAPKWHERVRALLPEVQLTLLIGRYAQAYYLGQGPTLTERVRDWHACPTSLFPLVHPSPRNGIWLRRNPWFETEVVPALQARVAQALAPKGAS